MTTSHHLNIIYTHACTPELDGRPQKEEPVPMSGCDPDFGWSDGADGSGKCYMVIKNTDYTWVQHSADLSAMSNIAHSSVSYTTVFTIDIVCVGSMCGTDYFVNGMSWFTAMECCYYNKGYLAEPQNQAEQDKIVQYITAGTVQCSTV